MSLAINRLFRASEKLATVTEVIFGLFDFPTRGD